MEEGAPGRRMHEADELAPGAVVLGRRTDPAQERLEANAMLIRCPQLDAGMRKGSSDFLEKRSSLVLNCACAASSACTC